MKFTFKIQQYQSDAVNAVVKVFDGQRRTGASGYLRDLGEHKDAQGSISYSDGSSIDDRIGYKNESIKLISTQLLENIHAIQDEQNIRRDAKLSTVLGACSLDVEMETGTGKTYVYIKTMFELYEHYGWRKFIIVVPSIAIREGVKKSFEMMEDHFMEQYGKKVRHFVYDSSNLQKLDDFSSDNGINVMIINMQAFNAFDEGKNVEGRGGDKAARIIYNKQDRFGSRRPIDVIAANRPIIILDEPQKMGGAATQKALKQFNPLFSLNYSATHKEKHNTVYVLDSLDAFNKHLVKKIKVKGFEVQNMSGTERYMYLDEIVLSKDKPPVARISLQVKQQSGIKEKTRLFNDHDDLYTVSNNMEQYKGFVISKIDPYTDSVSFTNGVVLKLGDVYGDVSEREIRRLQIRETIKSHFAREEELFGKGIKVLSLFFIDEVANYRTYDEENGGEVLGGYGRIFEEEYLKILTEHINLFDSPYNEYLKTTCSDATKVHAGYFSIDKKGRYINSKPKRGSVDSDDLSAYDLILKNKERLLNFDEPTRFIFSHSALREGWDNPNVFQICTLKNPQSKGSSETNKRQEVGRGLRICVDQSGARMDEQAVGDAVHDINTLTVITSESYTEFVDALQDELKQALYDRPQAATREFFKGKRITVNSTTVVISEQQAKKINKYLYNHDYIGDDDKVTDIYKQASKTGNLAPMPEELRPYADGIHTLVKSIFDESVLKSIVSNGRGTTTEKNELNANFKKPEFQALWQEINHKYAYTVHFDSDELVEKAVERINKELFVSEMKIVLVEGQQKGTGFSKENVERYNGGGAYGNVRFDLVGKVAAGTELTRRTTARILKQISTSKLFMFRSNPEEFIAKVVNLINEAKSTLIVEHISYNKTEGTYDSSIFTAEKQREQLSKAYKGKKSIQDYVFTDGLAEESVEKRFVKALDEAAEVEVYAKLPRGFSIPTPVGNYSPDWAIAFKKGSVKHIFFIAETKGSMSSMQLKPVEQAKISCASKLFNEMPDGKVKYHKVSGYDELLSVMQNL